MKAGKWFVLSLTLLLVSLVGITGTGWAQPATVFGDFSSLNPPGVGPRSVAVSGTGDVYIGDNGHNRVLKVAAGQTAATEFGDFSSLNPPGVNNPLGVAVSGTGDVYILDYYNDRVLKVAAGQTAATVFGDFSSLDPPGIHGANGIAVSGTGDVYITDGLHGRVLKVAAGQTVATVFGDYSSLSPPGLNDPSGIAVSGTGDVYIIDYFNYRVLKVAAGQTAATEFGDYSSFGGLQNAFGIAVSGTGDVYITRFYQGQVLKVAAGQTAATEFGDFSSLSPPGLSYPTGIAVSGTGDLYIADGNGRVVKVAAPEVIKVAVNPTKVNFGSIYTGQVGHGEVHIVNVGNEPLSVSAISQPQGEQSSFFDIFFEASLPTWLQPGEELVVQTDFTPQDQTFYQSFFDVFTNDPNDPAVRVTLCGNGVFPPTTLHFEEAFARPGGHAVVDVAVESNQSIAGLQFKIQPYCNGNPAWLVHFNGLINDLESDGWTATSATDPNGVTTVLFFHTGGGALPPYQHHKILELIFDIDPDISFGKWIDLVTWDVVLSDPNSQPILFNLWQGKIHIGHPGDLAGGQLGGGDGHADILDVIKLIKKLLGLLPQPEWGTFDFFLCDVNGDGSINILDLVALINDVLNEQGTPSKVIADGPTSPVTVSLGDVQTLTGTQLAVPVTLTANGTVAGVQATFMFDAAHLQLGTPQLVGAAAGMTVQSQIVDGTLRVIVYSATGQVIPAGSGALLVIPATLLGDGAPELRLADVLVADRGAQAIPVTVGTSAVKVAPLPTAFALKGARPNPFNPTTRLAYDVPKQAHIVVAVYNLLGQEVIRLVDAEQQPGRYELVWNGRNAQGLSVASGVYLYRLTSSSGFSETKRMTLLK